MHRYEVQILRSLKESPKSFWKLLDEQDEHIRGFVERLRNLLEMGLVRYNDGKFSLTPLGEEKAARLLSRRDVRCPYCQGGYVFDVFQEAFSLYHELVQGRPLPNLDFDQGFMTERDVFARVAFLYERGDLEGQTILVLGDDDLFSLALASTGLPHSITVLEVDERIVQFIAQRSKEYNLGIQVFEYNAADPYPLEDHVFSVFVTDPVESEKGLKVTLSRGAQALKKGGALYFGLTTIESSWHKWYNVERMLLDMGFAITDVLRRFSAYPDADNHFDEEFYDRTMMRRLMDMDFPLPADADWFRSSFIRCEAVEEPKPLVVGSVTFDVDFYIDDETMATPRFR
ncbi:MAG: bis-aminopropyl spermidine synthase family protein [Candidatus Caldatribacterium sp.]|uniref:bis-aminopropyl spermidine synthase family protein n=1 Tax=Candidatus Caldatribacterium sp. TaxID=2282143 RepID=UPI002997A890|nr:bis-aminopropyl spermidine synthase family protein [Candidatus Caldatribacterium sp.]MCX7731500.1 bis-aminopropyl spermidine synthase family protein [Candidatus Caldatribacterium sp.]MDW8081856.1 bis-aminopropyl spermidine synthase family protein [Candidatus Calescibacterium sp.]